MIVAAVSSSRYVQALQLFFRDAPEHRREEHLQWSLDRIATGEMRVGGLLGLYDGGSIVGCAFAQVFPDGYVSHWLPEVVGDNSDGEDMLLQESLRRSEHAGGRIHQVMLEPERRYRSPSLIRNGFVHLTRVLNLARTRGSCLPAPVRPEPLGTVRLHAAELRHFGTIQELIPRTHRDTLDCPELNGLQSPEEILAGYRYSAPDPSLWRVLECDSRIVGLTIVSRSPGSLELNYLGVLPEYRRRGLAAVLLAELLDIAGGLGVETISLNVDRRNLPARRLYETFGFEVAGMQEAYVKPPGSSIVADRPNRVRRL